MSYYKLYFQKEAIGGDDVGTLTDVLKTFGFVLMSIPYDGGGKPKDTASYDWHDEHGLEVLNTTEEMKLQHYDITFQLGYKGTSVIGCLTAMRQLRDYLLGADGSGRLHVMYNDYTGIGRGKVTLKEIDNEPTYYRSSQGVRLFFNVTMTVNDPYHFYTLRGDNLTLL